MLCYTSIETPPAHPESAPKRTAIITIGNSGVGKSTLLTQLGAKSFKLGVLYRRGVTKDIFQEEIELNSKRVMLIDVPGLNESNEKEAQPNAKRLTHALSRGYDYKPHFVAKADNRVLTSPDLVLMSKINKCVKKLTAPPSPSGLL